MKCQYHDSECEWIENDAHPDGGFWFCEDCWQAEEDFYDQIETSEIEYPDFIPGTIEQKKSRTNKKNRNA